MRKSFGAAPARLILLASLLLTTAGAAQERDGDKLLIALPQGAGAWLLEVSRDGGMRPSRQVISINSDGEVFVYAEHYAAGAAVVDCYAKAKLTAEDFLKLKEAVRSSSSGSWLSGYSDKKHPICCDQPTTRLKLHRREASGSTRTHRASWYPGSSELRPADLAKVAEAAEELWNKARERCEAGEANE